MAVAELFLSAFISVLLEKLASGELLDLVRREGIHTQLKKWSNTLLIIQAVLSDAEEKQITNKVVKKWLDDLQDLAYDLDDILDEFATEALRRKLMAEPQASTSKVRKLIPTCCTSFTPSAVKFDYNMRSKIKEITARLQDIAIQKSNLHLNEIAGGIGSNRVGERLLGTSLVDEPHVYGRDQDKEAVLELLLRVDASDDKVCVIPIRGMGKVCVIPIQGMGGVGKTTLAQLVYNDDKVSSCFDLKAWACVSDDFDVLTVTKTVLESLTSQTCDYKDLNKYQEKLQENLSGKKFLLVLDDIWDENYEKWDLLRRPFLVGAPGSKIIATTRIESVALMMGSIPAYQLKELPNDDCLSLLAQHALGRRNFDGHPDLKETGEEIAKKCKGLPLAAKTLGGLLRAKLPQNAVWKDVLNSKIWDLPEEKCGILPSLRLSYHHLPSHSKQCFAYCSIFPKDYEFDKDELVLLWMAEGLLQLSAGKKQMEDFGSDYFDDLLSRSFFQQSSSNKSRFVMHDLINDLAHYVAGEICFRFEVELEGKEQYEISKRARHASYIRPRFEVFQKFKVFHKAQGLRTFLPLPVRMLYSWQRFHLSNRVLIDLLPKLQYLRVLSLSGYSISELPNSIGDLKHLRYLNLSETSIKLLPESVSTLYNLQTLSLRNCDDLCKLPSSIGNLINLRHLDIGNTRQLQEMPSEIGKLTSLQTLPKFVVGKSSGLGLMELKDLSLLRGTLSIEGLQNFMDLQDAKVANLKSKEDLDELGLAWSSYFDDLPYEECEMRVLDELRPHKNLKRLTIEFYGGTEFSSWVGDPSFSEIVNLSLDGCRKCTFLPPLGQLPKLKDLCVRGMHGIKSVGEKFYRDGGSSEIPFQFLEILKFDDMPEWEEWSCFTGVKEAASQFPRLRELTVRKCPKLNTVPLLKLPTLCKLDLQECSGVVLRSVTDLTSLTRLRIESISHLNSLHKEFTEFLVALEVLEFSNCSELVTLWQHGVPMQKLIRLVVVKCPQLVSLGEEEQGLPCSLEELRVYACDNLEKLPNNLTSLKDLCVEKCAKLVSFPETGVPPMLRRLEISECEALMSLPNGISRLEHLEIKGCPSLTLKSLPTGNLPSTLKVLEISHLESVSVSDMKKMLQDSSMSLERFEISNLPNLEMLPLDGCVNNFQSLVSLFICDCDALKSFPQRGLPTPNLRVLFIWSCKNLRSFPFDQIHSLESLVIKDCPSLECFPKGDLPPNLKRLWILNCEKLKPLSEWGLHRLTSLRYFKIKGGYPELVSFPDDDECLLPATLTELEIEGLPNLESLSSSKGLQNLTSLKYLTISDCPKLQSLPKGELLSTLSCLEIRNCPLLKQRCLKDKGEYWPKIADIPRVRI